jgi:hypothetical protein
MAADSCWMSARSSATVWERKVSDVGSTESGDWRTLQALMPLMRAATQLRLVLVDVRDPRRTLQIVINHRLREKTC